MQCLNCGDPCAKKFCSRSCAAKVNNRGVRRHGKSSVVVNCKTCGKKTRNPIFCSRKCAANSKREQAHDRIRSGNYELTWSGNAVLRDFLISERGYKCENCGNAEWFGLPIPLSVHHKDGDASNNKVENMSLLCLNCHGITPNYGRKNKRGTRKYRYMPS